MPDTHKYVILFADGREIATPPAEDLDIEPRAEGGLRKGRLKLLGGRPATILLDFDKVLAVYPVATGSEEPRGTTTLECQDLLADEGGLGTHGGTRLSQRWPYEGALGLDEPGAREEAERRERRKKERRAAQSRELDREIVTALERFEGMKASNLADPYPILRSFERRGIVPAEVREFLGSREVVRERLDAMREEGLVLCTNDGRYRATEKGTELSDLVFAPVDFFWSGLQEHRRNMVGLCQAIMASVSEKARWVTDRELLDDAVRNRLEEEIGRRLPVGRPNFSILDLPPSPGGVLILEETGTMWAIVLELPHTMDSELADYEALLPDLAQDPALDGAYLVFWEEQTLRHFDELAVRKRQDGFFVCRRYRVDDPLGLWEE